VTCRHTNYILINFLILFGKPGGRRHLARPRCRWKNYNRMDLREIGWEGVDWIHVAQDGDHWQDLMNTVMNLWVQ
jgi:hypothetical protein